MNEKKIRGRNPCFSGIPFAIETEIAENKEISKGRNPCFSGIPFAIKDCDYIIQLNRGVAILVLVEYLLQ